MTTIDYLNLLENAQVLAYYSLTNKMRIETAGVLGREVDVSEQLKEKLLVMRASDLFAGRRIIRAPLLVNYLRRELARERKRKLKLLISK